MTTDPKKILAVANGNIGDFVLATSALSMLRQARPYAEITVIAPAKIKEFIENLNFADKIIYTDFSFTRPVLRQRADQILWFIKNRSKIKNEHFDDCIFLDHTRFFAKAIPMMKIKNLTGPSTWWCGNNIANPNIDKLTDIVRLPADSDNFHMAERYQSIVRHYLNSSNLAMPVLPKTDGAISEKVRSLLQRSKSKGIVMSMTGEKIKGNERVYPHTHTAEFIKSLNDLFDFDIDFYFVGTQEASEYAKKVKELLPEAKIRNLCKKTNLRELKAVMEQNDLLISVDTGTIHIAAATKINIVGIYGPNRPENSRPLSCRSIILYSQEECSPCHCRRTVFGEPCLYGDHPLCMSNITPDMIVSAAKKILGEQNENI